MKPKIHTEHRKWEREEISIPVRLVLKTRDSETEISTATMNISLSGISIVTTTELVPKQEVEVLIEGKFTQSIPAQVVWVNKEGADKGKAGLKFLQYRISKAS
jgi:c-di-GMP-binding flagellar brake protein YcgR